MVRVASARILSGKDELLNVLPLVNLTTTAADNNLNACYALEISSHVIKPLDFETLIGVIRRAGLYWMLLASTPLSSLSAQYSILCRH